MVFQGANAANRAARAGGPRAGFRGCESCRAVRDQSPKAQGTPEAGHPRAHMSPNWGRCAVCPLCDLLTKFPESSSKLLRLKILDSALRILLGPVHITEL